MNVLTIDTTKLKEMGDYYGNNAEVKDSIAEAMNDVVQNCSDDGGTEIAKAVWLLYTFYELF